MRLERLFRSENLINLAMQSGLVGAWDKLDGELILYSPTIGTARGQPVRGAVWPCALCHRNWLDFLVLFHQGKRTGRAVHFENTL